MVEIQVKLVLVRVCVCILHLSKLNSIKIAVHLYMMFHKEWEIFWEQISYVKLDLFRSIYFDTILLSLIIISHIIFCFLLKLAAAFF